MTAGEEAAVPVCRIWTRLTAVKNENAKKRVNSVTVDIKYGIMIAHSCNPARNRAAPLRGILQNDITTNGGCL